MSKTAKKLSAEEIAKLADQGKDVSKYFTNTGKMKLPTQRVNIDFTLEMLSELEPTGGGLECQQASGYQNLPARGLGSPLYGQSESLVSGETKALGN